jgi:hypothetical protein
MALHLGGAKPPDPHDPVAGYVHDVHATGIAGWYPHPMVGSVVSQIVHEYSLWGSAGKRDGVHNEGRRYGRSCGHTCYTAVRCDEC